LRELERKVPKLLSPVRSLKGAVRVVNAGADEIYCDVRKPDIKDFELKRGVNCEIPSYDELGKVVKYAHNHDVEVQLAANIPFMTNVMDDVIRKHIRSCLDEGVDALIIGDLGILSLVKRMGLDIPLYASTFLGAMNYGVADFLKKQGFKRVILERQMRIPEISEIVKRSDIEVEVFVHGSGCSNIDGTCHLFHFAFPFPGIEEEFSETVDLWYPCSIPFEVEADDGRGTVEKVPILDAYTFCSLCRLPELVETGIKGLKIVGRESSEEYQERTTRLYREALDLIGQDDLGAFEKMVAYQRENFVPAPPNMPSLRELCCERKRCFYGLSLFCAPYKLPPSWRLWTKSKFKIMVFEREDIGPG